MRGSMVLASTALLVFAAVAAGFAGPGPHAALRIERPRAVSGVGVVPYPVDGSRYAFRTEFTDADGPTLHQLRARFDWGDGKTSNGALSGPVKGRYSVAGTHTWADEGQYVITLTITDSSVAPGSVAIQSTTVTVSEGDIAVAHAALSMLPDQYTTGTLLTFTDGAATGGAETDNPYVGTVDWGDGTQEFGTVTGPSGGVGGGAYAVSVPASVHFYNPGHYKATVTLEETGLPQTPLFSGAPEGSVGGVGGRTPLWS